MRTHVINLLGGSGLGKSTTAAGLFYHMKLAGLHCELVREYVKNWAWQGKKIGPFDQAYLFGKQSKAESMLYGQVEYVVTDSPLLLCPIYEEFYDGAPVTRKAVEEFLKLASKRDVTHHNFLLKRKKAFDPRGRYETAEQAKSVDIYVETYMQVRQIPFTVIDCQDDQRVSEIMFHMQGRQTKSPEVES